MFFKMLGITLIACWFISIEFNFHRLEFYATYLTELQRVNHTFVRCFYREFFKNVYAVTGLFLVPLNQLLLYPVYRCIAIKNQWKVMIGSVFQLIGFLTLIVLVTYSRSKYFQNDRRLSNNYTVQCLFHLQYNPLVDKDVDYRWVALAEVLFAISYSVAAVGIIEFYCAQVPFSMKELMAGT